MRSSDIKRIKCSFVIFGYVNIVQFVFESVKKNKINLLKEMFCLEI